MHHTITRLLNFFCPAAKPGHIPTGCCHATMEYAARAIFATDCADVESDGRLSIWVGPTCYDFRYLTQAEIDFLAAS